MWQLGVCIWARSHEAALVCIVFVTPSGSSLVMILWIPVIETWWSALHIYNDRQWTNALFWIRCLLQRYLFWAFWYGFSSAFLFSSRIFFSRQHHMECLNYSVLIVSYLWKGPFTKINPDMFKILQMSLRTLASQQFP